MVVTDAATRAASVRVTVAMMQIGIVWMLVPDRRVPMPMGMRFARRVAGRVIVPVVLIMRMSMLVLHGRVGVLVLMSLGQMQNESCRHERRREPKLHGHGFAEGDQSQRRADERRRREVGARPRRAEMTQRQHEQD